VSETYELGAEGFVTAQELASVPLENSSLWGEAARAREGARSRTAQQATDRIHRMATSNEKTELEPATRKAPPEVGGG
jgi:hypothetical protein